MKNFLILFQFLIISIMGFRLAQKKDIVSYIEVKKPYPVIVEKECNVQPKEQIKTVFIYKPAPVCSPLTQIVYQPKEIIRSSQVLIEDSKHRLLVIGSVGRGVVDKKLTETTDGYETRAEYGLINQLELYYSPKGTNLYIGGGYSTNKNMTIGLGYQWGF